MPERSRFAVYRDRRRGGPVRALEPCGTYAAARRHERRGEALCAACRVALLEHHAAMNRRRAKGTP